jgi:RNA-directed DNA polymerase
LHSTLIDRVRAQVKDKRVLALVEAFIKEGVLTDLGDRQDTLTGTGGINVRSSVNRSTADAPADDPPATPP